MSCGCKLQLCPTGACRGTAATMHLLHTAYRLCSCALTPTPTPTTHNSQRNTLRQLPLYSEPAGLPGAKRSTPLEYGRGNSLVTLCHGRMEQHKCERQTSSNES